MARGYLVIEGQGEEAAASNLISRLWADLGLTESVNWGGLPRRVGHTNTRAGIAKACGLIRGRRDADALLILRDADDECPATLAPRLAGWIREEAVGCPAAIVLFKSEYEVLFLPCIGRMAGQPLKDGAQERPGLREGVGFEGDHESIRGVKEWLSRGYKAGRKYKPTTDQLPMTRMIDFAEIRGSGLPCFGSLERALRHLDQHRGSREVYPPASEM